MKSAEVDEACHCEHVFLDACFREIEVIDGVLTGLPADVLIGDTVTAGLYLRSEMKGPPSAEISVLPPCLLSCDPAAELLEALARDETPRQVAN